MSRADRHEDRSTRNIEYDAESFRSIISGAQTKTGSDGANIVFVGNRDRMQDPIDLLAGEGGLTIHRFDVSKSVSDSQQETMGNLREAFDSANDTSVLVLDHVDEVVRSARQREREENLSPDAQTELDYLFQRMASFRGICILLISGPAHQMPSIPQTDVVIRF